MVAMPVCDMQASTSWNLCDNRFSKYTIFKAGYLSEKLKLK
jgi:hypothetical protein